MSGFPIVSSGTQTGTGSPVNVVVPTSAGAVYTDQNTGNIYVALTSASSSWVLSGGGGGSGTVTTVSVVTANGFAGTVANASTTPAITLTTTITGVLKGNGTAISAAVAGTDYTTPSGTEGLSNKRVTRRVQVTNAPGATPSLNTDNFDEARFTGLAANVTSMTTNLSGTPNDGDTLILVFTDNGTARTLAFGASFANSGTIALPSTTVINVALYVALLWNATTAAWVCVGVS